MSSSSACHQHVHQHVYQHVTSMSTSMSTHQILVLVEHVKLIWSELAAPVEEIVHCVVARLGPQVGVLHVRQNPMVCLRLVQLVRTWDPQVCQHQKICFLLLPSTSSSTSPSSPSSWSWHLLDDKGESGGELLLHLSQLEVLLRALQVGRRPTLIILMIVVTMLVLMMIMIMLTMLVLMMTCAILGTRLAMLKMSSKIEVTCVTVLNSLQFLVVKYFRD